MELPRQFPIGDVGRDEGGDGYAPGIGKELGDFSYPADVLLAVLWAEAEVLVEPETDIVAVKPIGALARVQQRLFERDTERRLARCCSERIHFSQQ